MKDSNIQAVEEAARKVPVAEVADVIVCGAGPAGVAAALRSARAGARTRLLEVHGCLGGVWTSGFLSCILDADKPDGLMPEILDQLEKREGYRERARGNYLYDPEQMKLVLERMCLDAGVSIQLHTRVTAAVVESPRRLRAVITESKSGRQAWMAPVFIDCTGDGDLAALAGCAYALGREEDGAMQPMSLMAIISGLDAEAVREFHDHTNRDRKPALRREFQRAGHDPSYAKPALFHLRGDLFALMANHEYGVRPDDARGLTDATLRARAEVDAGVRALRSLGGIWKDLRLIATAPQIGVREGRRIQGRDTVVAEDLTTGKTRKDAVCRVTFGFDVHSPDPTAGKAGHPVNEQVSQPYDIPYRALVAADVDGLLLAGRCISGDFLAHSSYRVTGNAVAMGEAAGLAAAHCAKKDVLPHEISWPLPEEK